MLIPRRRVAAVSVLLLWPRFLFAWSANSHRTIARIAEDRLSPAAAQAVHEILGPGITLEQISHCADDIRGQHGFNCAGLVLDPEPQSQPWHFVDVPVSDSPHSPSDLAPYCPSGACVVDQIRAEVKALMNPGTLSASDKQIALMFLVHFVADEHQPMHCSHEIVNGESDRGGNQKAVTWAGPAGPPAIELEDLAGGLNLHSLWDHLIAPRDTNDPPSLSAKLENDIHGKDVSSWTTGDFIGQAALESFTIAKEKIYPAYYAPGGAKITKAYQDRMQPLSYERLEKAGVRLAALLEQALVGPTPSQVPPQRLNAPTVDLSWPDW